MPTAAIPCPVCASEDIREVITFEGYNIFSCNDCDMSFAVPETAVTANSFENYEWTREWTQDFPSHVKKAHTSLQRKLRTIAAITGADVKSLFDIGCGNGAYLAAASRMGLRAEGTDLDRAHVQFAREQGLNALHVDIAEHPTGETYDFVHIKECLHLVSEPRAFLRRATEFMHRNSVLYVDSTHHLGLASRFRQWRIRAPRFGQLYPPLHNRTYHRRSLSRLMDETGLVPVKFVTFSKGDQTYCPTPRFTPRQYLVNALFDAFFLGGFIGCYARLKSASAS